VTRRYLKAVCFFGFIIIGIRMEWSSSSLGFTFVGAMIAFFLLSVLDPQLLASFASIALRVL